MHIQREKEREIIRRIGSEREREKETVRLNALRTMMWENILRDKEWIEKRRKK